MAKKIRKFNIYHFERKRFLTVFLVFMIFPLFVFPKLEGNFKVSIIIWLILFLIFYSKRKLNPYNKISKIEINFKNNELIFNTRKYKIDEIKQVVNKSDRLGRSNTLIFYFMDNSSLKIYRMSVAHDNDQFHSLIKYLESKKLL